MAAMVVCSRLAWCVKFSREHQKSRRLRRSPETSRPVPDFVTISAQFVPEKPEKIETKTGSQTSNYCSKMNDDAFLRASHATFEP